MSTLLKTPQGELRWAKVLTPDTTFKEEGEYSIEGFFNGDDVDDLIAAIDEAAESKKNLSSKNAKIANLPYEHTDDGRVKFKFKQRARYKDIIFNVDVYDNLNNPWDKNTRIGNGSIGRVAFSLYVWEFPGKGVGITLQLKAVQVIELVAYDISGAVDFGFEAVEGNASSRNEVDIPFAIAK
jgi:hypothetical protein